MEDKVLLQSDQFEEHPQIRLMGKGGGEEEEEEQENGAEIAKEVTEAFHIDPFAVEINREEFEVVKEDEADRAPDAPQSEAEDDIKKTTHLIGKEGEDQEEEQDDGDNIAETVKEVIETNQKEQFAAKFNPEEIQIMKEDEVIGAPDSAQTEAEDHPQMQRVEKEEENGANLAETVEEVVKTAQKVWFTVELVGPEAIQVMEEEKATDSPRIEAEDNTETQLIEEEKDKAVGKIVDNPLLRLTEEEEEEEEEDGDEVDEYEYEDEEEIADKGEGSSVETGDSSMESNAESIWPAEESIEELSLQLKEESETNIQKLEEKIDEYRAVETADSGCYASIKNEGTSANGNYNKDDTGKSRISPMKELLTRINVSIYTSKTGMWISSAAVLLLLRVVTPLLLSFANIVKLCLIIFFLVIFSHIRELPQL